MAQIIGDLRPDATYGETRVLDLLRELPDDYVVWPELPINAEYITYPDFTILHPSVGVCVLEVKDWVEIVSANPSTFVVRTRKGRERHEKNPLTSARVKATKIARKLEGDRRLVHLAGTHRGKLILPWGSAVVFPNLTRMLIHGFGELLNPKQMICMDDLETGQLEQRLLQSAWFPVNLSPAQVDAVRSVLFPELRVSDAPGGEGVLDLDQERIAKEGLYEKQELTPEGRRVALNPVVRLVRGVAGSGKTLVLSMRAKYLAQTHPDWRILVVTFNRPLARDLERRVEEFADRIKAINFHLLCKEWLAEAGLWQAPIDSSDQQGRIANILANKTPEIDKFEAEFLRDEFNWMKDTGLVDRDRYLEEPRIGRHKRLAKSDRALAYQVFEHYQRHLEQFRRCDWADIPYLVVKAVDEGLIPADQFDSILVDEAQDFAPSWFEVLKRVLNPETGVMFMAADATQRIYRKYTWKSVGLHVVGRARILRRSYRSTYEIARTAFDLVRDNETLLQELKDEGEELQRPQLDPTWMRRGEYPALKVFRDVDSELAFIIRTIKRLLDDGYSPGDIAILHRRQWGPGRYLTALRAAGLAVAHIREDRRLPKAAVAVGTLHLAKGLEYRVVFVAQLQCLFDCDRWLPPMDRARFNADELRLLYVGMTRARDRLYLTYQSKLPGELTHLDRFLDAAKS